MNLPEESRIKGQRKRTGGNDLKKVIRILLIVLIVALSILPLQTLAAGNRVELELGKVRAGQTDTEVRIPMTLTVNEGFATLDFTVGWDPAVFQLKGIELENWIRDNGSAPVSQSNRSGSYRICLGNPLTRDDYSETGLIGSIVFKVLNGASSGSYPVTVTKVKAYTAGLSALTVRASNGSVTFSGTPVHVCPSKDFTDFDQNAWYHESVDYAVSHGLMKGTSPTTFEPGTTTTRAMIVTILWRLEGEPTVSVANPFDDVASGAWYTGAVVWAAKNGIVEGYGEGRFGPGNEITREQLATMLYRYAEYKGYDVSASASLKGYTDAGTISSWALAAIKWANAEGLVNGRTATTIVPQGKATRAETAAIFMRMIEN